MAGFAAQQPVAVGSLKVGKGPISVLRRSGVNVNFAAGAAIQTGNVNSPLLAPTRI